MMRGSWVALMVVWLAAGAVASAAAWPSVVQLVRDAERLDGEEAYLAASLEQALGEGEAALVDPRGLPEILRSEALTILYCRTAVEPSGYTAQAPALRAFVKGGGTLIVEYGGVYLLRYMDLATMNNVTWSPVMEEESAYLLEPLKRSGWTEELPGLPRAGAAPEERRRLGMLARPGFHLALQPRLLVPHTTHAFATVTHTPGYPGWFPPAHAATYPAFDFADYHVLLTHEEHHIFPHLPRIVEVPLGDGRVLVNHQALPIDAWQPGPASEEIRAALLREALDRAALAKDVRRARFGGGMLPITTTPTPTVTPPHEPFVDDPTNGTITDSGSVWRVKQ